VFSVRVMADSDHELTLEVPSHYHCHPGETTPSE
jgi:hypothetical protein